MTGDALAAALGDLARLRIAVFREWPYLYDGDLDYEAGYLQRLAEGEGSVIVGAFDGDALVGAATGAPLATQHDAFVQPVAGSGAPIDQTFYFAESVLLPDYRGRGIGNAFFDAREAHARSLGFDRAVFCSVARPSDHPEKPEDYRPLTGFWKKRGYRPLAGVVGHFSWKDVGSEKETEKPMQFWIGHLV
mgnify:CR=1 FL=1